MNQLYYGDNFPILQRMPAASVDLIYLDPPFNSQKNYNLLYRNMTGKPVSEQVEAFCDTWEMDAEKEQIVLDMPQSMHKHGIADGYIQFWRMWIDSLRPTNSHLLAYLIYMSQRLLELHRVLKPTGSLYLHCDPAASHYIKLMLDGIFGQQNFRSEIIWRRTGAHNSAKRWGPIHDTLFFYSASKHFTWNRVLQDYDPSYIEKFYRFEDAHGRYQSVSLTGPGSTKGSSGQPWRGVDPTEKGRHWAVPLDRGLPDWFKHPEDYAEMSCQERLEVLDAAGLIHWPEQGTIPRFKRYLEIAQGVSIQDIISDIRPVGAHAAVRTGYPTQKPIALLKRIISASSRPGEVVLDPFCGCGTTICAAHETGRTWIGCDIAVLAINLIRNTLAERYRLVEGSHYAVDGIPVSVEQAQELFRKDPFQFQNWLVEQVGGFPTLKKTGDRGIDGRLYFETQEDLRDVVLSVKGGAMHPTDVRDLRGVLERENKAEMAALLSLREPTQGMRKEAAQAGMYQYGTQYYPRMQLLTVHQILEGKRMLLLPTKVLRQQMSPSNPMLPFQKSE